LVRPHGPRDPYPGDQHRVDRIEQAVAARFCHVSEERLWYSPYDLRGLRNPALHDRVKYRWRNRTGRLFGKLKNWRCVAIRCNKTADSCIGFVSLASALLWPPLVPTAS